MDLKDRWEASEGRAGFTARAWIETLIDALVK